jgi:hypothetical protein
MKARTDLLRSRYGRLAAGGAALVLLTGSCLYARATDERAVTLTGEPELSATSVVAPGTDPPGTEAPPGPPPTWPPGPTTAPPTWPPPPPIVAIGPPPALTRMTCLPGPPTRAADYQSVFANRAVWSGGDIGATVDLGDGRVVWLFGDTFVDGLGPNGVAGAMVRNSLVVQRGACFSLATYGPPGNRRAALPAAQAGEWLWPNSAVVDPVGLVHVTALRMVKAPGAPMWDWRVVGLDVVTLRWSDLALVATRHANVRQNDDVRWSGGAFVAGVHVYVYGWQRDHQIVARSTLAGFGASPWEVFTGSGWSTDVGRAVQPAIDQAPATQFWVVPHRGGYLASGKRAEMDSDDVSTWWAPSPVGPFRAVGRAARTEGAGSPWITYAGRVSPLPGAGLVTVWSRNYRTHDPNMDLRLYGPQFAPPMPGSIP